VLVGRDAVVDEAEPLTRRKADHRQHRDAASDGHTEKKRGTSTSTGSLIRQELASEIIQSRKYRRKENRHRSLSPRRREAGNSCCTTLLQGITKIGTHRAMNTHR
jgi:hypothetical protein